MATAPVGADLDGVGEESEETETEGQGGEMGEEGGVHEEGDGFGEDTETPEEPAGDGDTAAEELLEAGDALATGEGGVAVKPGEEGADFVEKALNSGFGPAGNGEPTGSGPEGAVDGGMPDDTDEKEENSDEDTGGGSDCEGLVDVESAAAAMAVEMENLERKEDKAAEQHEGGEYHER